nr:MAG TPA: Protein of unknown function (DUF4435) [Caudoviricetes sp.]
MVIDNMGTENLLSKMTSNQHTYEGAYMEFVYSKRAYRDHVFCFYEGIDSSEYYNSRVEKYFTSNIIKIIAGGKQEILNLYRKINVPEYKSVCKMFFVDKNFEHSIYSDLTIDTNDIYETEGYSFINYFVTAYTLEKILSNEFSINKNDSDSNRCVKNFIERLGEYNILMLEFNAILFYYCRNKSKCKNNLDFSDKKLKDFALVTLENVTKSLNYNIIIDKMKHDANISETNINIYKEIILATDNLSNVCRGKNQLEFFEEYIKLLIDKKDEYFENKNISINLDDNTNKLSLFCKYAYTPKKLIDFIKLHYKEFEKN